MFARKGTLFLVEIVIDCKLIQSLNTSIPTSLTLSGISIDCRLVQQRNADSPISVTLSRIIIDCKLVQPLNAFAPITVTLSGITIDCRLVQPLKDDSPISVVPSGIITFPSITSYSINCHIIHQCKYKKMCLTMSKLSTFLCHCKSFVTEVIRSLQYSICGIHQTSMSAMIVLNLPSNAG